MNNLPVSPNQSGSIPPPTSFYQDSAVWDIIPLPYIILGSSAGWLGTTPQPRAFQNYSNYSMQHLSLPTLICPFFPSCGNLNSLWPFAPSISWLTWCFPMWLCMACHAAIVTTWLGPLDYRSIGGPLKWMSCKTFFIGIFYCFILFRLCFFPIVYGKVVHLGNSTCHAFPLGLASYLGSHTEIREEPYVPQ